MTNQPPTKEHNMKNHLQVIKGEAEAVTQEPISLALDLTLPEIETLENQQDEALEKFIETTILLFRGRAWEQRGYPTWNDYYEARCGKRMRRAQEEIFQIAQALIAEGLTQKQVGAVVGLSQARVNQILAGKTGNESKQGISTLIQGSLTEDEANRQRGYAALELHAATPPSPDETNAAAVEVAAHSLATLDMITDAATKLRAVEIFIEHLTEVRDNLRKEVKR